VVGTRNSVIIVEHNDHPVFVGQGYTDEYIIEVLPVSLSDINKLLRQRKVPRTLFISCLGEQECRDCGEGWPG
jgi:hypothetical protein